MKNGWIDIGPDIEVEADEWEAQQEFLRYERSRSEAAEAVREALNMSEPQKAKKKEWDAFAHSYAFLC